MAHQKHEAHGTETFYHGRRNEAQREGWKLREEMSAKEVGDLDLRSAILDCGFDFRFRE
jgi:hypothetical protein